MQFSLFDRSKKAVKLILSYPSFYKIFKELKETSNNRAIIIGAPIHANLGDHLIAVECLRYIKSLGFEKIIEIPEFVYELFPNHINLLQTDTIFIEGGGWMGNLYEDELVIEHIITRWINNRIVILPQTIHFSKEGIFSSIKQLRDLFAKTTKLTVCVRDRASFDLCIDELGLTEHNCLLAPDMALYRLDKVIEKRTLLGKTVIYSLRNDVEQLKSNELLNSFRPLLREMGYTIIDSSTVINKKIVRLKEREKVIERKINEYANADLVITDRLHSMVFSLVAGTKCIAIDNSTHKVVGVKEEWLTDYPGLRVFNSAKEVMFSDLQSMIKSDSYPVKKDFSEKFENIKCVLFKD